MILKHNNPTKYRPTGKDNKSEGWAYAPYNFVPLPERVITVDIPPDQSIYVHNTGYIECTLTTSSPLYIRCAMTPDFFKKNSDKKFDELDEEQKKERGKFYHTEYEESPVIPGSSLRGMVRALVEIAGFGKMQWVGDNPKVSFRAVATPKDPLAGSYMSVMGKYRENVEAGYLEKSGDEWFIRPAKKLSDIGLQGRESYLWIRELDISKKNIPGFVGMNESNYTPQTHDVTFNDVEKNSKTRKFFIKTIGSPSAGHRYRGMLVCSGNMSETNKKGISKRKNHIVVLEKDPKAGRLKISEQGIKNYKEGLTDFQKTEPYFHKKSGFLKDGRAVFYVAMGNTVDYFGHNLNFRIPAVNSKREIVSPLDFVPEDLKKENDIDLAESIFGYIHGKTACAGRVFFTDGNYVSRNDKSGKDTIFLKENAFPPRILASPKPTTFQHYLVQNNSDEKSQLAHYDEKSSRTVIRGHKLYWHKGEVGLKDIEEINKDDVRKNETQYTRIKPVKPGVNFSFRIYFENLLDNELGAILWVLSLPGEQGKEYRHKLGMGKPLGMGSVKIGQKLHISKRSARYMKLFEGDGWAEGIDEVTDFKSYLNAFEEFMLKKISPHEVGQARKLSEIERIKMLLKIMEWKGPDPKYTRYLKIEPDNEFKERPVLPDPFNIEPPTVQKGSVTEPQSNNRKNRKY